MISMDKTYRTRDGREVRLLCVDRKGSYPVIGLIDDVVKSWESSGKHGGKEESPTDLIEVVPDVVRWVNLYSDGPSHNHPSRDIANHFAKPTSIAILKITTKNGGVNGAEDVSVEVLKVGEP